MFIPAINSLRTNAFNMARGSPGGGASVTTYGQDTFTDTNGTALTSHTAELGGAWTGFNILGTPPTPTIQTNKASQVSGIAAYAAYTQSLGISDGTFTLDVTTSGLAGAGASGLVFRLADANNMWWLDMVNDTLGNTDGVLRIVEYNAGSATVRASSAAIDIQTQSTHSLSVTLSGNSITATIDGGNSINYSSAFGVSNTKHGLLMIRATTAGTKCDNWLAVL